MQTLKALMAKKPKNGKKSRMVAIEGNHEKFTHTVKGSGKRKQKFDDSSPDEDKQNLGKIFKNQN